jgi:hypothetical protein
LWYTTPGNARVIVPFAFSEELIRKFDLYLDMEGRTNYDIVIRGGDVDLLETIDMTGKGRYPDAESLRRQLLVELLEAQTDKRLTAEEFYEIYRASPLWNILYDKDVPVFRSGDYIEREEDAYVTKETEEE